ncbi:MAG: hypothetical protein JSS60_02245 [Verrucomicrobia bacterium]|nr:hypothetical protein [Verrucomicrobiota bacterium]
MKKEFALSTVVLMTLPAMAAWAVEPDSRVTVLESQMNEISMRTAHGNIGAKTASASPQIQGEYWYFTGDMLWWHADEGGMDYAELWENTPTRAPAVAVDNRRLNFKWDYGFRAGIGKIFAHDKWDLQLNFTWFRAENSSASSLHGQSFLVPLFIAPNFFNASQVKAHWNLHFYTLDLTLGRNFFVSPKLSFHPYAGVKTAWIDQSARSSAKIFSPAASRLKSKDRNDFWGIGPSAGFEGRWFLDYGLHLIGSAGGAILWGDFDVRHKEKNVSTGGVINDFDLDLHQVSPMVQTQIGIGYETNLYHNSYHLCVNVLYENQYWWGQNQMPNFSSFLFERFRRFNEDLSLQGITVDVRFDF